MKKKKYVTREYLLQRLIALCMEISTLEKTEGKPQVFFNYAPHVQWLSIEVYSHGWEKGVSGDYRVDIHTDKEQFSYEQYAETYRYLEGLKNV